APDAMHPRIVVPAAACPSRLTRMLSSVWFGCQLNPLPPSPVSESVAANNGQPTSALQSCRRSRKCALTCMRLDNVRLPALRDHSHLAQYRGIEPVTLCHHIQLDSGSVHCFDEWVRNFPVFVRSVPIVSSDRELDGRHVCAGTAHPTAEAQ